MRDELELGPGPRGIALLRKITPLHYGRGSDRSRAQGAPRLIPLAIIAILLLLRLLHFNRAREQNVVFQMNVLVKIALKFFEAAI